MPDRKRAAGKAGKAKAAEAAPKAGKARRPAKPRAQKSASAEAQQDGLPAKLRVKQVRSGIGHAFTYRRTLVALGLRHHQAEVVVPDTPSVRGMLFKVAPLVRVRPEEA